MTKATPATTKKLVNASEKERRKCCGSAHLDAEPDSTDHPDADPDSDFLFDADPDSDPDPTFRPYPVPDPDPSFKKRLQPLIRC
jgi:hypothetical protein